MATALRSLIFNLLFYIWGTFMHVLGLPLLLLPRRATERVGTFWVRTNLWLLRTICGLKHQIRGRENLPEGPYILAAKHQSAWDTLIFTTFLPDPTYVLKRELIWFPLFGLYIAKIGVVPVDRSGGAKALRLMVKAAQKFARQGRPIVIFPEGTRTAPGAHRPYQPGVAALYRQLDLPVVPVALNSGLFWRRREFLRRPGTITLEILPAIPPGLTRKAFLETLEDRIETASRRLANGPASAGDAAPQVAIGKP
ncbi:MAG: 1-acyl-sn-glycerol-3-phosphate acyltransferase [Kiloniellales bacterium]|nr:1-acyl-sn-glycerol-3-phosphate acyltransferase [Kiloniellales bacterium]